MRQLHWVDPALAFLKETVEARTGTLDGVDEPTEFVHEPKDFVDETEDFVHETDELVDETLELVHGQKEFVAALLVEVYGTDQSVYETLAPGAAAHGWIGEPDEGGAVAAEGVGR